MNLLAEILAVMVVWLSSLALGQFGIAIDKHAPPKPAAERTVSRSPRGPVQPPVAATPRPTSAPTA